MDYLEYKGYKGSVEYSKADNCLFGRVLGLNDALVLYEGDSIEELEEDFRNGIDSYIEGCLLDKKEPQKPCNGDLHLKISPDLHSRVAEFSYSKGISIDMFVTKAIKNELQSELTAS